MRGKITKAAVDALQKGESLADTEIKGFVARRLHSGVVTYGLRYRAAGRQRWLGLGLHGHLTPETARKAAKRRVGQVADNRDPAAEREAERKALVHTVDGLLDDHLERYVKPNLRSAGEIERCFEVYVKPEIGKLPIYTLKRSDIVEMLDKIEDENGPVMADRVLAHLRKAFNWHAARDDRFNTPIVVGMARTSPAERKRKRRLDDQEIRDVWKALDAADIPRCFPALVRFLLLSARRRSEAARMDWSEVDGDVWIIPAQRGETQGHKTGDRAGDMAVPITPAMAEQMGKPRRRGFVFSTTDGNLAFKGFSKAKAALDKTLTKLRKRDGREPMHHWTLHDLRRTGRSLMSRAGVDGNVAERVLGHVIPGVRGVYDRHEYLAEKRNALERLAQVISEILAGRPATSPEPSKASNLRSRAIPTG